MSHSIILAADKSHLLRLRAPTHILKSHWSALATTTHTYREIWHLQSKIGLSASLASCRPTSPAKRCQKKYTQDPWHHKTEDWITRQWVFTALHNICICKITQCIYSWWTDYLMLSFMWQQENSSQKSICYLVYLSYYSFTWSQTT